jgi:hypothetical protein
LYEQQLLFVPLQSAFAVHMCTVYDLGLVVDPQLLERLGGPSAHVVWQLVVSDSALQFGGELPPLSTSVPQQTVPVGHWLTAGALPAQSVA